MIFCPNSPSVLLVGLQATKSKYSTLKKESLPIGPDRIYNQSYPSWESLESRWSVSLLTQSLTKTKTSLLSYGGLLGRLPVACLWKKPADDTDLASVKRSLASSEANGIESDSTNFENALSTSHRYQPLLGLDFLRSGEVCSGRTTLFQSCRTSSSGICRSGRKVWNLRSIVNVTTLHLRSSRHRI